MPSLTRAEAVARAELLTVDSYEIRLDLDQGPEHFGSATLVRWSGRGAGRTFLDVKAHDLHSLRLDGMPLPLDSWADGRVPIEVTPGQHTLAIEATMAYRRDGSGLHRSIDPADGQAYVYAQSFLDFAPAIFACFDQPDLKARISLHVKAPDDWIVLGNGRARRAADVGPGEWVLTQTPPISTYLVTVCAGPYVGVLSEHGGIPLGLHTRASLEPQLTQWAPQLFEVTAAGFDAYHELFGIRYPFGDYHQAFVPDFNAVAMENPGCVTLRDALLYRGAATPADVQRRTRTLVHEMAHMWFGNLVTMKWWDDLWLNESFAEYLAHRVLTRATEFEDSWVDFGITRKPWGYAAERAPSAHPVAGAPARTAADALSDFDGISYAKGASAIRQLIAYVGDEHFVAGVAAYLREKAFGNGTFAEFLAAIESASSRDLQDWARAWLLTSGRDTLTVELTGPVPVLTVRRPNERPGAGRVHVLDVGTYSLAGASQAEVQRQHVVATTTHTPLPELPVPAVPHVPRIVLPNCSDLTWASVDLDEDSLAALPTLTGRIADPLARSVIWQLLDDAVARAAVDPRTYLAAVQHSWPLETYDALALGVADHATVVVRRYLPEPEQAAAYRKLAEAALAVLGAAEPGSPLATIAARLAARTSRDEHLLRSWLGQPPAWLTGDLDFRWSVLTTLAIAGQLDEAELDAAESTDASVSGRLAALHARAARPLPTAKEWAFEQVTAKHAGRSNHELVELARGLWRAPDPALVRDYVVPFLDAIPRMTAWVGEDALGKVVRFGFPWVVEPATIEAVDAALARDDLPGPVRRAFVEWSWPLREALAVRTRWPATGGR